MKIIPLNRLRHLAFGLCWLTAAAVRAQADDPWLALRQEYADQAGAAYVPRLQQRGFTAQQARETLACLADAPHQGVPDSALSLRLEEGLAKHVEPQGLLAALQTRLRFMAQARAMVQAANYDMTRGSPCDKLLTATGLALESGVPPGNLADILQRGRGQSAARIQSVIEAGETLTLAGVDPVTTRTLMNDCLERDLRRMEVLRAVRYTLQQHRGGLGGDAIRRSLWGRKAIMEGAHGWHSGGQQGPADGTAPGGMGPGPGGSGRPSAPQAGGGSPGAPAPAGPGGGPGNPDPDPGTGSGGGAGGSSGNHSGTVAGTPP